jgi:hypothetical protein
MQTITPQAITGNWYDPNYSGSGFNMAMTGSGLVLFYYGWDKSGNRLWLMSAIGPTQVTSGTPFTVNMSETVGGHFLTPASPSTLSNWGTLSLNFSADGTTATATLFGTDGKVTLNLQKLIGMTNVASVTGEWYDPAHSGSGFNVVMAGTGLILFYYGWDNSGNRLWLISDSGPTPIVMGTSFTLNMSETNGGSFLSPAKPSTLSQWGTLQLDFSSCTRASAALTGQDGTVTLDLQMLAGVLNMLPGC